MTDPHQQQRYRVIDRLASGGMAEVFVAESAGIEGFKKRVAIKRVLPHLSEKKRFIAMFLDEARLSAHLSHSNVVQVFDIGVGDKTYFIVMEYVDGADLKAVMKHVASGGRPFPIEAAVYIAIKICEGLSYAHERTGPDGEELNAVHRDISPPNVLISKHGEVKIVDFGLAKASTQLEKSEAGIIKGKFSYLSPEAANGLDVDPRADIYAVGIILWEMLAGKKLFRGNTDYETVKLVQKSQVLPISQIHADADSQLDRILARTLTASRDDRYSSARSLGQDLARYLFRLARPVSAFDIAELVRAPMQERKAKEAGDHVSIIDKLIAESLLEFTSLRDKSGQSESRVSNPDSSKDAPLALSLNFEEFGKLADQTEGDRQSTLLVRNTLPADVFEEGNLAALEGPEEPLPRSRMSSEAPPSGRASSMAPGSMPPSSRLSGAPHSLSPASQAPISMAPSSVPGSLAPGSVPGSLPPGSLPPGSLPPGSLPPGSLAPGSLAPDSARPSVPLSSSGQFSVPPSSARQEKDNMLVKAVLLVVIAAGTAAAVLFSGLL